MKPGPKKAGATEQGEVPLPASPEAEASLIGAMIFNNTCISKVAATLEPEAFFGDSNREVYKALLNAWNGKGVVDLVVLKDAIPGAILTRIGGVERIAAYADTPNPENWGAYLKVVEEKWRLREAYEHSNEIKRLALEGADLEKVWEVADKIKSRKRLQDGGFKLSESIRSAALSLDDLRKAGVDLKVGLNKVDELIGGIRRKMLYIVGAKTSNGKTSFLANIAINILRGKPTAKVLINVFENAEQIPVRMASVLSGVPLNHFLKPDMCTDEEYLIVQEALQALDDYRDRVVIMHGANVQQMRAMCDEFKPDAVFVDYIQRYAHKYSLGAEDRLSHAIGKVASDLQDMAIDKNCAMFVLSQLSRRQEEHRNRKPVVTDLKESGDLENYADCIFLLWWPWRDNPNGKDPNEFFIVVAKNKLGPCQDEPVKIDVKTLRLSDWGA